MHSFLPDMVLLKTVKVNTYQKYNSIDAGYIFLQNKLLPLLANFNALNVPDNLNGFL